MNLLFMQNGLAPYGIPRNGLVALYDPWRDTYGRNIMPVGSEDFVTWWERPGNATITVTPNQADPFGGNGAYRIQSNGNGTNVTQYMTNQSSACAANTILIRKIYAKILSGNAKITRSSGANPVALTTNWTKVEITVANGIDSYIQIRTEAITDALDILVYQPQVNLGQLYPYSPPAGMPQSLTDYTGRGNNAVLGSTAGADTNDPKFDGVALVGDGVDDYAVVPLASAAYRISVVDSGSGYTVVDEVPAYLNLFQTGASTYLNGKIGPTAYYNRVLTAGEIAQAKAGLKRYMASKGVTVV